MVQLFKKYRPALLFVLRFFVVYTVLTLLYSWYLQIYAGGPDPVTRWVAGKSVVLVEALGYSGRTQVFPGADFVSFFVNDTSIARVVEGCNSLSVIILFIAFVIAYRGPLVHTLLFILGGTLLIYVVNTARVALLIIGLYEVPEYGDALHRVFFPLVIYGLVFLLWVMWVRKFAGS
ncbi:exosortase family protein XrtF [Ascidiimonas aurantiaca]|uniref:exosortase family protein XrtF n=1 Tax=Ascidiimonas aurantiaca TaxID=1685432 RepID=UPI0030ED053B